ncbi:MAG TPA: M55 family metallopeptidase [Bacillota bacterium]|nr:M55 family metallopeptidase [Bacillota bacterium]
MRVYISVDIEGVAGIVDREQGNSAGGVVYEHGRRLMTAETNAAIDGAFAAGATEVVVNDSHGGMRNLVPTELDPRAVLIHGRIKPWFMVEGLDASFDAMFLVGYHAPAGVRDGVLNHAFHPYELRCNGQVFSETGLSAMVAGHYGVPTALVTGDDAAMRDADGILGKGRYVGVSTKRGISRMGEATVHPEVARARIREGAMEALRRLEEFPPYRVQTPVRLDMDFYYSQQADIAALIPTTERLGDRRLAFTAPDAATAYRTFLATYFITRDLA